jgi:hypothetical protein
MSTRSGAPFVLMVRSVKASPPSGSVWHDHTFEDVVPFTVSGSPSRTKARIQHGPAITSKRENFTTEPGKVALQRIKKFVGNF